MNLHALSKSGYLITDVDWVDRNLAVSYRASEQPQEVRIQLRLNPPRPPRLTPVSNQAFDLVAAGLAGGARFDPARASLKVISGDPMSMEESDNHIYIVEVAGVAPMFMRHLASLHFALPIRPYPPALPESLSIHGSLPLDDSPDSIREADIQRWLRDPEGFAEEWPDVRFAVSRVRARKGLSIRLRLAAKSTNEHEKILTERATQLVSAFMCLPSDKLDGRRGLATILPSIVRSDAELAIRYGLFETHLPPAIALVVNMVHRFSTEVVAVEELIIGAPH